MAWRLGLTADQLADRMAEHILETARSAGFIDSAGGVPAQEERRDTLGSSEVP